MILQVVKVGNSRGLRLPKGLLEQYHIDKEVDLSSTKEGLLIKPLKNRARAGWSKKFKEMAAKGHDKLLMPENIDFSDKDWKW